MRAYKISLYKLVCLVYLFLFCYSSLKIVVKLASLHFLRFLPCYMPKDCPVIAFLTNYLLQHKLYLLPCLIN